MANYRFSAKVVSRGGGQSVIAKAAYNHRAKLRDERTGELKDYSRAGGVLFSGIFAPKDAPRLDPRPRTTVECGRAPRGRQHTPRPGAACPRY
jgi:hypothetical protein